MKISYVIPLYNEEESLIQLYNEICQHSPSNYEIIFINDGSTDNSQSILEKLANMDKKVKVVQFRKNFGKAAGLNKGFELATGDIVFTMDADLQDNPSEIPNFLKKIEEGYDLVSGWKKTRHDPLSKTIPSKLFNFVTQKTFDLKLHDYNCGFKAYKKDVIKEVDIYGELHRYIPALAKAKGFRITEIPVVHRARQFGKSKYGLERYLRGFFDLLTVKLTTQYAKSPLYLFGGIGTILTSLGLLTTLYLWIMHLLFIFSENHHIGRAFSNRPLLYIGVLMVVTGIQFFSIGLLGELLVNVTRSSNKKKQLSIKKTINISEEVNYENQQN